MPSPLKAWATKRFNFAGSISRMITTLSKYKGSKHITKHENIQIGNILWVLNRIEEYRLINNHKTRKRAASEQRRAGLKVFPIRQR